jgi:hypothetical protein
VARSEVESIERLFLGIAGFVKIFDHHLFPIFSEQF